MKLFAWGVALLLAAGPTMAAPSAALSQAEADLARATLVAQPTVATATAQFVALRRHFALTPSLHAWGDHAGLLATLRQRNQDDSSPAAPAWRKLLEAEGAESRKMRAALSRDFAASPAEVLMQPPSTSINVQLAARSSREFKLDPARMAALGLGRWGGRAPGSSWITPDLLIAGFAGGPLISRMKPRDPDGVVYAVSYDARSAAGLADLYEIAKARRLNVKASWRDGEMGDLGTALLNGQGKVDQLVLTLRLPVWVVTEKGLLPGVLRRATYGSDACGTTGKPDEMKSSAEIVLAQPARGDIHAIVASTGTLDPAKARVMPQRETRVTAPGAMGTLTHRVLTEVDLDGDGVPDLRTVISQDQEISQAPWLDPSRALSGGWDPAAVRRTAGWYAHDLYQLEANEQGWWRVLSRYSVVTCT
jgi:hypothetical protein